MVKSEESVRPRMNLSEDMAVESERLKRKDLLLEILEALDAFEYIFKEEDLTTLDETRRILDSFKKACSLIYNVLSYEGVTPMDSSIGKSPDPVNHYVIRYEKNEDFVDGVVLKEAKKGYFWQGNLLRQARVVVNRLGE